MVIVKSLLGRLGSSLLRRIVPKFRGYARLGPVRSSSSLLRNALRRGSRAAKRKTLAAFEYGRKSAKGAWRKFQVDPAGNAVAIYSATKTPSLRLELPDGRELGRLDDFDKLPSLSQYSSW